MNSQQILERAIQKTIDGGVFDVYTFHSLPISAFHVDAEVGVLGKFISDNGEEIDVATVIFNYDFAKALFGEPKDEWTGGYYWLCKWEPESESFKNREELLNSWIDVTGDRIDALTDEDSEVEVDGGYIRKSYKRTNKGWQYHLQQMVIADDPIKYLGEHLE